MAAWGATMTSRAGINPSVNPQRRGAFTLIELIVVMALLAIVIAIGGPRLARFFHGQTVMEEGQRLLALTRYGQSRAASEGSPMELWMNLANGTYGLRRQAGANDNSATPPGGRRERRKPQAGGWLAVPVRARRSAVATGSQHRFRAGWLYCRRQFATGGNTTGWGGLVGHHGVGESFELCHGPENKRTDALVVAEFTVRLHADRDARRHAFHGDRHPRGVAGSPHRQPRRHRRRSQRRGRAIGGEQIERIDRRQSMAHSNRAAFGPQWPGYQWTIKNEPWTGDTTVNNLRQFTVEVTYPAQNQNYSVKLSTILQDTNP